MQAAPPFLGFREGAQTRAIGQDTPGMCSERKKVNSLSCVWLFATPWTAACQAPPSMGFSRQKYWSGLPFPSPEN